jgi:chaperone required for assembly of F1-ATPase
MAEDFLDNLFGPSADPLDPREASRRSARRASPKRFWREVAVIGRGADFAVALDGRIARTPLRHDLAVPSPVLAERLACEWRDVGDEIDPSRMPLTRLVNTAIDAVTEHAAGVAADIVKYAGSDLLCYREALNERLAERQAAHWDPPLAYMREAHGARFMLAAGVIFTPQTDEALAAVASAVSQLSTPFGLAALHSVTTLTGSAILALALAAGRLSPDAVWAAAHVDEDFQIEAWGEDAEARERRAARRIEFDAAAFLLSTLR